MTSFPLAQTPVAYVRSVPGGAGAIVRHVRAFGSYAAPSSRPPTPVPVVVPPHTNISWPDQTATCRVRADSGAGGNVLHARVDGLYDAPSANTRPAPWPPHTTISSPVHTPAASSRATSGLGGKRSTATANLRPPCERDRPNTSAATVVAASATSTNPLRARPPMRRSIPRASYVPNVGP